MSVRCDLHPNAGHEPWQCPGAMTDLERVREALQTDEYEWVPKPEFDALVAQRDTLLAALREIATKTRYGCCAPIYPDSPICSHNIARAAIAEVEGEKP